MPKFKTNSLYLDQETVAEQLRATRQAKGWKLEDISKELKISVNYLDALETNRYQDLPAGIYGLNFLREYAEFLDLEYGKLREKFLQEKEVYQSQKQSKLFMRQVVQGKYFWAVPRVMRGMVIALIALLCFVYIGFLLQGIFVVPKLEVASPLPNLITDKSNVVVSGETNPETEVLINDVQIIVDDKGGFSQEINLKDGINVIVVTAQRNSKKQTTVIREVLKQDGEL